MKTILKNKGLSETPFRLDVLNIVKSSNVAVSISELENKLGEFNRITLYRTLKTFIKKGIIHPINIVDKEVMYAMCEDTCGKEHYHNHLHLECKLCNSVSCIDIHDNPVGGLTQYQIDSFEIYAKGICVNCKTL